MARKSTLHLQSHRIERQQRKPMARNAANARERSRMRILTRAFSRLKTALPWVPADTKLSKLDTLRLASSYIAYLRRLLTSVCDSDEEFAPGTGQQQYSNMSWPFCVSQQQQQEDASTRRSDLKREDSVCADSDAGADCWSSSGETGVQEILY